MVATGARVFSYLNAEPDSKRDTPDRRESECIGRESNPGLAESLKTMSLMATANFTTKPPMLFMKLAGGAHFMLPAMSVRSKSAN